MTDTVFLRNAAISAVIGRDCWHREKSQPALISLRLLTDIELTGETDDVVNTIDYGTVYKAVADAMTNSSYPTLDAFTEKACRVALKAGGGKCVKGTVMLPKALLQAEGRDGGVRCEIEMEATQAEAVAVRSKTLSIRNLRLSCIIGVNKHEREHKQLVVVNLKLYDPPTPDHTDYQKALMPVFKHIENSSYQTLEAFVVSLAKLLMSDMGYVKVTISAEKPNAYGLVDCPGVEITRTKKSSPAHSSPSLVVNE
ncbi:hypothetical protein FGG08_007350 [Glutinoglossum americanum]|uniref:dihydroneopterin aldolase n=1 Tax=Glutinoglossum americanum TaxID=1670608 RepID=A0A9P8KU11_9PEZI|nr:hypothetical protein FGG08_007350 [Glutinoglossum americanum]